MATLNRLLNLLSYVINICWMCFVYLTLDTAQKVVWLCNIRWVDALGVSKISEHTWNLKNSLPEERCFHSDQRHARSQDSFSSRHIFHFTYIIWQVRSLILQNRTTAFGTMSKKASTQNTNCQIGGLKHWVCSVLKGCIKNALCCDMLSTMNIAVHWMIWWSPMHHIQTVMTE